MWIISRARYDSDSIFLHAQRCIVAYHRDEKHFFVHPLFPKLLEYSQVFVYICFCANKKFEFCCKFQWYPNFKVLDVGNSRMENTIFCPKLRSWQKKSDILRFRNLFQISNKIIHCIFRHFNFEEVAKKVKKKTRTKISVHELWNIFDSR